MSVWVSVAVAAVKVSMVVQVVRLVERWSLYWVPIRSSARLRSLVVGFLVMVALI